MRRINLVVQKAGMHVKGGEGREWGDCRRLGEILSLNALLTVPCETVSNHTGGTALHPNTSKRRGLSVGRTG